MSCARGSCCCLAFPPKHPQPSPALGTSGTKGAVLSPARPRQRQGPRGKALLPCPARNWAAAASRSCKLGGAGPRGRPPVRSAAMKASFFGSAQCRNPDRRIVSALLQPGTHPERGPRPQRERSQEQGSAPPTLTKGSVLSPKSRPLGKLPRAPGAQQGTGRSPGPWGRPAGRRELLSALLIPAGL